MRTWIFLPAYNEEESLKFLFPKLKKITDHLSNTKIKIVILDDGSSDLTSKLIGKEIAEKATKAGIAEVVFDRNGYLYHGRVKALADSARESGLKF